MASNDPGERREISELGAHARWGSVIDRAAATAPGRAALRARFDRQVPDSVTDPDQRADMINHLIAAHMIKERRNLRRKDAVLSEAIGYLTGGGAA